MEALDEIRNSRTWALVLNSFVIFSKMISYGRIRCDILEASCRSLQ